MVEHVLSREHRDLSHRCGVDAIAATITRRRQTFPVERHRVVSVQDQLIETSITERIQFIRGAMAQLFVLAYAALQAGVALPLEDGKQNSRVSPVPKRSHQAISPTVLMTKRYLPESSE